jgi:hypothetical protein
MLANARAADAQVVAAAALQEPAGPPSAVDPAADQVTPTDALQTPAVRPADALPPGAADPAARNRLPDLSKLITATLRGYLDGQPNPQPLLDAINAQLTPDPAALSSVLEDVWDQTLKMGTQASKDAMRGRKWDQPDAIGVGMAPLLTLAPVVTLVAGSIMAAFGSALPPVSEYPDELQAVMRCLDQFGAGLTDGMSGSGLCDLQVYEDLYTKFATSMQDHMLIATTVIQAGMLIGIGEKLVGDLIGIVALILLLSSGPILVAVLCYAGWSLWQAGAEGIAHDMGYGLGQMAADPFLKLQAVPVGLEFLLLIGRLMGPLFLEVILFMIGEEPLSLAAKGAAEVAPAMREIWAILKLLWKTKPETKALFAQAEKQGVELLEFFEPEAKALGQTAYQNLIALLARSDSEQLLKEMYEYFYAVSDQPDLMRKAVGEILEFVAGLSDEEYAGLKVFQKYRPHANASPKFPGPRHSNLSWVEFVLDIEDPDVDQKKLFGLLGPVADRLVRNDDGIVKVISEYVYGGSKNTGAIGALAAAKEILAQRPDSWLRFEVDGEDRILDIVAYRLRQTWTDNGFRTEYFLQLVAEVKNYPSGLIKGGDQYEGLLTQMRKDLVRHATNGDPDLEMLAWFMDQTGYTALKDQMGEMFWEALTLEKATIVNAGVDFAAVELALMDRLNGGLLLMAYQI